MNKDIKYALLTLTTLLFLCVLTPPNVYAASVWEGPHIPGMTDWERANSPGPKYPFYVREIPVTLIDYEKTRSDGNIVALMDDLWLWGEQWTGPEFSEPGFEVTPVSRMGLNMTFIRENSAVTKDSGTVQAVVAYPHELASDERYTEINQTIIAEKPAKDIAKASEYLLPVLTSGLSENFLTQESGISPALARQYQDGLIKYREGLYLVTDDPDRNIMGRYHLMIYDADDAKMWQGVEKSWVKPRWDAEKNPSTWDKHSTDPADNHYFYRGRNWDQNLCDPTWHTKFVPGESIAVWYNLLPQSINLQALSLDPGATEVESGRTYTATVTFRNDSLQTVEQVPLGVYCNNIPVFEYQVNFAPGEEKQYSFEYTAPDSGQVELKGVINTDPLPQKYQEPDYSDNIVSTTIPVISKPVPGNSKLTFKAYTQSGKDANLKINEAKWTNKVTATLTVDQPTPPAGWLDWWQIDWAKLSYPKKHPDFTFGNPVTYSNYPASRLRTVNMTVPGRANSDVSSLKATVQFEEDWAMDGAKIYNPLTKTNMAEKPRDYDISASYKVTYQYSYKSGDKIVTKTKSYTSNEVGKLKITGTGVDSRGN